MRHGFLARALLIPAGVAAIGLVTAVPAAANGGGNSSGGNPPSNFLRDFMSGQQVGFNGASSLLVGINPINANNSRTHELSQGTVSGGLVPGESCTPFGPEYADVALTSHIAADGTVSFSWDGSWPSFLLNPDVNVHSLESALSTLNAQMLDPPSAVATGDHYVYLQFRYQGGTWDAPGHPAGCWEPSVGSPQLDDSVPFRVAQQPSLAQGQPIINQLSLNVFDSYRAGAVQYNPSTQQYVFVPSCYWLSPGNLPWTPQTSTAWQMEPVADGLGGTDLVFLQYALTVQVDRVELDFSDGTALSSTSEGYSGTEMAGWPSTASYNGGQWSGCSYQKVWKHVGSFTVTAKVFVSATAVVTWFDGAQQHFVNLSAPVAPPIQRTAGPFTVFQIEAT